MFWRFRCIEVVNSQNWNLQDFHELLIFPIFSLRFCALEYQVSYEYGCICLHLPLNPALTLYLSACFWSLSTFAFIQ